MDKVPDIAVDEAAFQGCKTGLLKPVHISYLGSDLYRDANSLAKDETLDQVRLIFTAVWTKT